MTKKTLSKAKRLARNAGYDGVGYLGEWRGYSIYELIFNDDEVHYIGKPQYILASGIEVRWGTVDECDMLYDWELSNI